MQMFLAASSGRHHTISPVLLRQTRLIHVLAVIHLALHCSQRRHETMPGNDPPDNNTSLLLPRLHKLSRIMAMSDLNGHVVNAIY